MPKINATLITVASVAAGVIAAGYILKTFEDVDFIAKARSGFDTGFL